MSSLCTKVYYEWPFTSHTTLGPFEKWGIDLTSPLPMTMRGYRFIIVATYYLTKFVKICALKSSMKQKYHGFCMNGFLLNLRHHLKFLLIMVPSFLVRLWKTC
jgi:hypothetical protein